VNELKDTVQKLNDSVRFYRAVVTNPVIKSKGDILMEVHLQFKAGYFQLL
jgi:hypothetical protein